jgi:hypothetical protein
MAVSNRQTIINKLQRVLKKHYQPVKATSLSVMDTLLYAACLEDARYESADKAFDRLRNVSFDLNELRVTSVSELAEHMPELPYPRKSAANLKRLLQSVFESQYSYDLEPLKKQNLGKAIQILQKHEGSTQFIVAYVVQHSLAGHSIPVGRGSLECLYIAGVIDEKEKKQCATPGLERTISKSKGDEFGSLLHQLGAELVVSPYGPKAKGILLEIDPDAKSRLPKRTTKKQREAARKKEVEAKRAAARAVAEAKKAEAQKVADARRAAAKKAAAKKSAGKKPIKVATPKKAAIPKKAPAKKKPVKGKPVKDKQGAAKKTTTKKTTVKAKTKTGKKAQKTTKQKKTTKRTTRRKPR